MRSLLLCGLYVIFDSVKIANREYRKLDAKKNSKAEKHLISPDRLFFIDSIYIPFLKRDNFLTKKVKQKFHRLYHSVRSNANAPRYAQILYIKLHNGEKFSDSSCKHVT